MIRGCGFKGLVLRMHCFIAGGGGGSPGISGKEGLDGNPGTLGKIGPPGVDGKDVQVSTCVPMCDH